MFACPAGQDSACMHCTASQQFHDEHARLTGSQPTSICNSLLLMAHLQGASCEQPSALQRARLLWLQAPHWHTQLPSLLTMRTPPTLLLSAGRLPLLAWLAALGACRASACCAAADTGAADTGRGGGGGGAAPAAAGADAAAAALLLACREARSTSCSCTCSSASCSPSGPSIASSSSSPMPNWAHTAATAAGDAASSAGCGALPLWGRWVAVGAELGRVASRAAALLAAAGGRHCGRSDRRPSTTRSSKGTLGALARSNSGCEKRQEAPNSQRPRTQSLRLGVGVAWA